MKRSVMKRGRKNSESAARKQEEKEDKKWATQKQIPKSREKGM